MSLNMTKNTWLQLVLFFKEFFFVPQFYQMTPKSEKRGPGGIKCSPLCQSWIEHCISHFGRHSKIGRKTVRTSTAVDKPKFMGHAPDHQWWKTGSSESYLGCLNYFYLSLKDINFFSY